MVHNLGRSAAKAAMREQFRGRGGRENPPGSRLKEAWTVIISVTAPGGRFPHGRESGFAPPGQKFVKNSARHALTLVNAEAYKPSH
jgi:hypothetical protein